MVVAECIYSEKKVTLSVYDDSKEKRSMARAFEG